MSKHNLASSPPLGGIDGSFYVQGLGMKKPHQIVHIRVPRNVVREARHRAADMDVSFAEFVRRALFAAVAPQKPESRRKVTP